MSKTKQPAYFSWDYRHSPPLIEICKAYSQSIGANIWEVDTGDSLIEIFVCPTKQEAIEAWKIKNKDLVKECLDEGIKIKEILPNFIKHK